MYVGSKKSKRDSTMLWFIILAGMEEIHVCCLDILQELVGKYLTEKFLKENLD